MLTTKKAPDAQTLLHHLADHCSPTIGMFLDELPKEMREHKVLHAAWTAGVIEFGRRAYTITGIPRQLSPAAGYSWCGPRRAASNSLAQILDDGKELTKFPELRLRIRLTDKGEGTL